jgi:hypothetical protein
MNDLAESNGKRLVHPDAEALARRIVANFRETVECYRSVCKLSLQEATQKADELPAAEQVHRVLQGAPHQVTWFDLERLAQADSALALQRWETIRQAALDELRSGYRAAALVEGPYSEPWQRAQFLALREDLANAWQPRNGIERQLIDTMAQAQTLMLIWMAMLIPRLSGASHAQNREIEESAAWNPPRIGDAEAVEQATGMVERFNKMFLRTLRSLLALRRCPLPPVVVQNAGQVNVGQQQMNVTG